MWTTCDLGFTQSLVQVFNKKNNESKLKKVKKEFYCSTALQDLMASRLHSQEFFTTSGQHIFCKYVERSQAKDITQPPSDKNNLFAARMTSNNPTATPTHRHAKEGNSWF